MPPCSKGDSLCLPRAVQSDKSEAVTPSVPTGGPLGVGLGEGQRQLKGVELEILSLTEKLLGAINAKDFATYQ